MYPELWHELLVRVTLAIPGTAPSVEAQNSRSGETGDPRFQSLPSGLPWFGSVSSARHLALPCL